uniref:Uncharacterized protein n=1 Tax=Podarcis muralis TaxID=64176 RepID=A0A670JQ36_PODMU
MGFFICLCCAGRKWLGETTHQHSSCLTLSNGRVGLKKSWAQYNFLLHTCSSPSFLFRFSTRMVIRQNSTCFTSWACKSPGWLAALCQS